VHQGLEVLIICHRNDQEIPDDLPDFKRKEWPKLTFCACRITLRGVIQTYRQIDQMELERTFGCSEGKKTKAIAGPD